MDLIVKVTDETGGFVSWAEVSVSGAGPAAVTDEQGQVAWSDLPHSTVTIKVSAQGMEPAEVSSELEPGENAVDVSLVAVPFGLIPAAACAPGETLLLAEDFQTAPLRGWGVYPPSAPFDIQDDAEQAGNKVLTLNFAAGDGEYHVQSIPMQESAVRRFKYKPGDHSRFNAGWGTGQDGYFIVMSGDEFALHQVKGGAVVRDLARSTPVMEQGVWHLMEISVNGESIEVWVDGVQKLTHTGPAQPEGHILGIGSAFLPPESIVLIDDVSLCTAGGTFTTLYQAP